MPKHMEAGEVMFHESYGELTKEQYRIYKQYNVSPSDHDMLVAIYRNDPFLITRAVKAFSKNGQFSEYLLAQEHLNAFYR